MSFPSLTTSTPLPRTAHLEVFTALVMIEDYDSNLSLIPSVAFVTFRKWKQSVFPHLCIHLSLRSLSSHPTPLSPGACWAAVASPVRDTVFCTHSMSSVSSLSRLSSPPMLQLHVSWVTLLHLCSCSHCCIPGPGIQSTAPALQYP